MKKESIKKNYFYNTAFQIVNLLLPIITTPYISNALGPSNIGVYSYTYAYISSFVLIGSMGIATYAQREIAAAINVEERSRKFFEIFTVKFISISIATIFFIGFAFIDKKYKFYYLIQLPYFLASVVDISWFYQGIEIFKKVSIRNILIKVIGLILIFAFVKDQTDLSEYLLILCITQVLGNLTMWINLQQYVVRVAVKSLKLSQHIKPALIYFVPTVAYQIYAVLDKAMLGILGQDIAQNGYYEQAHKLVNIAIMVIGSYNAVMRSRMSALFAQGDLKGIKNHMDKSIHFVSFLIYPMMFGLAGISNNLVPWFFGEDFMPVVQLLILFSPMFVIQGLRTCIGSHLITPRGSEIQAKVNYGSIISAVTNMILNYILIPKYAASGAIIASLASELIMLITCYLFAREYIDIYSLIVIGWKYLLAAFIMFIPVYILASKLKTTIFNTFFIVSIGVCFYCFVLLILREKYVSNYIKTILDKTFKK